MTSDCTELASGSLEQKMESIFSARNLSDDRAFEVLNGLCDDSSALIAHEAVYLIGQLKLNKAVPKLIHILLDPQQHYVVRHEAGEALAAIGDTRAQEALHTGLSDPIEPIRETCYLALKSLEGKSCASPECSTYLDTITPIASVADQYRTLSVSALREILHQHDDLYERYQALFELRDREKPSEKQQAQQAIIDTVILPNSSALLRHEVAFVLGQLQIPESCPALVKALQSSHEDPMVRHEAALALGSLGSVVSTLRDEIISALRECSKDPSPLVAESCIIGLNMVQNDVAAY